jgi:hypothetical protein
MPKNLECYFNGYLFQGGLSQAQAQTEGGTASNTAVSSSSGYWYSSASMTNNMCIKSCLKYGFIYAALSP